MEKLQSIVMSIVLIGIVLGVGFLVFDAWIDLNNNTGASVTNETIVTPTTTGVYPANNDTVTDCFNGFAVTIMTNATGGQEIASGNYSVNANTGAVTNLSDMSPYPAVNITYTYSHGTDSCESVQDTSDAVAEIPAWLTIIIIISIAGIILFIVFKAISLREGTSYGGSSGSEGVVAQI